MEPHGSDGLRDFKPDAPIRVFTDGACSGNPGPGGWAFLAIQGSREILVCGGAADTTNNRMELLACIEVLERLPLGCEVAVTTDSQYVKQGIESWVIGWKRKGWVTADRKPVKNQDLWQRLDAAQQRHRASFAWVRGHAGHPENERVDGAARGEARRQQRLPGPRGHGR